jgi:hypothetical protein
MLIQSTELIEAWMMRGVTSLRLQATACWQVTGQRPEVRRRRAEVRSQKPEAGIREKISVNLRNLRLKTWLPWRLGGGDQGFSATTFPLRHK